MAYNHKQILAGKKTEKTPQVITQKQNEHKDSAPVVITQKQFKRKQSDVPQVIIEKQFKRKEDSAPAVIIQKQLNKTESRSDKGEHPSVYHKQSQKIQIKAYNAAKQKKRPQRYDDSIEGSQLTQNDKWKAEPGNDIPSGLFSNYESREKFRKSNKMASIKLQDADAMLYHLYRTAAQQGRQLTQNEILVQNDIKIAKINILSKLANSDMVHIPLASQQPHHDDFDSPQVQESPQFSDFQKSQSYADDAQHDASQHHSQIGQDDVDQVMKMIERDAAKQQAGGIDAGDTAEAAAFPTGAPEGQVDQSSLPYSSSAQTPPVAPIVPPVSQPTQHPVTEQIGSSGSVDQNDPFNSNWLNK